jgi:serine-type D-Ala-D-Ala endopeptidase (penicillin-binding protein 7)
MIRRSTLPKVLLLLAGFVFFSANTVHFLGEPATDGALHASIGKNYQFDFDHVRKGPYLNVKSALLVNYENGEVVYSKDHDTERPVASITKLVTAMVVLDSGIDLDSVTEIITRTDARRSSRSRLLIGYEMTLRDLLHACLMNSDNRAARALARAVSGSIEEFAVQMNRKVKKLGLENTVFYEPTGLDARNVSTAHEVAKILHYSFDYELIAHITSLQRYDCRVLNRRNRIVPMANTNLLIHSRYGVLAGKTGYIRAADYCLVTLVQADDGQRLTLVVLGAPFDRIRFREARKLLDWGVKQLQREPVMAQTSS